MERLNYFNPYHSKPLGHEDHLTRAYLVLLKHSFHAFALFLDYCSSNHVINPEKEEHILQLHSLIEHGWEFDTQRGNPVIGSNWLLSVLITDTVISAKSQIQVSDRNARYDGIITFGSHLTMVIENKPRSGNVWVDQLNPSKDGLSDETKVYSNSVTLEWKEIIKQLNHSLNLTGLAGNEKMMVEDFLSFVDHEFPYLNPFDSFHLCKGNPELIYRRINKLLKSVVNQEELVKYHHGWGFYIQTPYPEIKEIGLIFDRSESKQEWWLELSFYFGDTQSQAKAFYAANPVIDHLSEEEWYCVPNFHVAYRSTNLVWLKEWPDPKRYIEFWKDNIWEIYQQKKEQVPEYFKWLNEDGGLCIGDNEQVELNNKFYDTAMMTLNICPGLGVVHEFTGDEVEKLDKSGKMRGILLQSIKDGLKVIGKDGSEFLQNESVKITV